MTDELEPPRTLMGWCMTHGKPDQWHKACPGQFLSPFGVRWVCSCPNHTDAEEGDE